jgi:hypothetical protein
VVCCPNEESIQVTSINPTAAKLASAKREVVTEKSPGLGQDAMPSRVGGIIAYDHQQGNTIQGLPAKRVCNMLQLGSGKPMIEQCPGLPKNL